MCRVHAKEFFDCIETWPTDVHSTALVQGVAILLCTSDLLPSLASSALHQRQGQVVPQRCSSACVQVMIQWLAEMGLDRRLLSGLQANFAAFEAYKVLC